MTTHRSVLLAALGVSLLAAASPLALAADVIVVDRDLGPGADFAFPSGAVAAADPGDVILVRAGYYEGIVALGSKPLVVIAEKDAVVEVDGILIEGLAAGNTIVVRGIDTKGQDGVGVECRNNLGSIWIEDTVVHGPPTFHLVASGGVVLSDNADVVLARGEIRGLQDVAPGRPTVDSLRTRLHLFDSTVRGPIFLDNFVHARNALVVRDGFALLSGVHVTGTNGGEGSIFACEGGDGGHALVVQGADSEVHSIGSTFLAGVGGAGYEGCDPGTDGDPVHVDSGSFTASPTAARSLTVDGPVREGQTLDVAYTGLEGDRVFLLRSAATVPGFGAARFEGAFFLAPPVTRHRRGLVDSSGTLAESFPVPPIGGGARVIFLQAYFANGVSGDSVAGSPATLVILDENVD